GPGSPPRQGRSGPAGATVVVVAAARRPTRATPPPARSVPWATIHRGPHSRVRPGGRTTGRSADRTTVRGAARCPATFASAPSPDRYLPPLSAETSPPLRHAAH